MPSISILLSTLNSDATLPQALDSLIHQTITDWECLIMDDGSTDTSAEILKRYAKEDSRFHICTHPTPQGLTASLIELSQKATGEFIARQDADDWSELNRFERQLKLMQENSFLGVAGSYFTVHNESGDYLDTVTPPLSPEHLRKLLKQRNPFAHGSLLMKRAIFEKAGGYRAVFRYAQDYDLLLRLSDWVELGTVCEPLYHHRLSTKGIGRSKKNQQAAYAQLALDCMELRKMERGDHALLSIFREDSISSVPTECIDPIVIHLVKSGQGDKARKRLAEWNPLSWKFRLMKIGFGVATFCPRILLHTLYRLFTRLKYR